MYSLKRCSIRTRRALSPKLILEAVSLVLDQGYSITQAYRALDIGPTALKRWINQLQFERTRQSPTMPALTAEQ